MKAVVRIVVVLIVTLCARSGIASRPDGRWMVRVDGATGLIESCERGDAPLISHASEPLLHADFEFPVVRGDDAVELDRGWEAVSGTEKDVSPGPSAIAAKKPMTLEWTFSVEKEGERRVWLLARHSEVSPEGRDQAEAYEIQMDGRPLSGTWRRLAVRNFGNAWLGWLDLGVTHLAAGEHRLRITTRKDWCFLDRLVLVSSGRDPAKFDAELASPRTRVKRERETAQIERRADALRTVERIEPVGGALRLSGRARWLGSPTVLRGVTWKIPIAVSGRKARLAFPDALPPHQLALPAAGQRVYPRPRSSLVVFSDGEGRGIAALAYSKDSTAQVAVTGTSDGPVLEVHFDTYGRVDTGAAVDLGQVLLSPARGGLLQAADAFGRLYKSAGLRAPARPAAWAQEAVIYCAHPGGPIERGFAAPGGFTEFAELLPGLAKMGVTALWLLPIFEHGDSPYSIYGPTDQVVPSRRLGSAQDLKALVDAAHQLGMRVLFDFVPHGPPKDSDLARRFPDAICLDEEGHRKTRWGWAFDYANPRWQSYMRDAASHSARAFGIDGARIDVFHGTDNWDAHAPYLASFPVLGGGLGMTLAIRAGISGVRGSAFIVPESYDVDPAMWSVAEATYDAAFYFLLEDLVRRDASPEEWASSLRWFMELQERSLPAWGLKMRFLANHDTVTSVFLKARPAVAFGYERSHALAAVAAFARGVPMLYEGEEDSRIWGGEDRVPSSVEFYRRLLNLRKTVRPLREGSADYLGVRTPRGVWACLRECGDEWAVGIVSLLPRDVELEVELPPRLSVPAGLEDGVSGEMVQLSGHKIRLPLPPYGISLLRPGPGRRW